MTAIWSKKRSCTRAYAHAGMALTEVQKSMVETQYEELLQTMHGSQSRSSRNLCGTLADVLQ